jgi:hypothetical protein
MPDSIDAYCRLWLDQNVGSGPALARRDAETLALAAEFLSDARHCRYTREDLDALGPIEPRILDARDSANSPASAGLADARWQMPAA